MSNINLIISGTLTGFSRFYTSSSAEELYLLSKIDFDIRNHVTFLYEEDKAYSISFASNVIAVSLVTRILDSFRRPGVLVASILLHRNESIVSAVNSGDKEVIYTLLNRVNTRFREKNFLSGMLNQNASVLMQDYYEDILQDYVVVSDPNQRRINTTVDWETPNKRIGYVKAEESSMPLYLSSLCRRSYTGYHFIIFSPKALPNIEEEPIEAVLYNVYVQNTRQNIPAVKLTDKIPTNVRPGMGEKPCPVDYTYQQVIAGEAGHRIMAFIKGEEIELSFNFEQEEKTVEFKFIMDGGSIPFETVCPVCEIDGTSFQISSPRFTFRGKEIYGTKILKSGNTGFIIKPESEALDISRIKDGDLCLIQVEHCTTLSIDFEVYNQPKNITLLNMKSGKKLNSPNVTRIFSASIPGNWEDWQIQITSDYYEPITQMLPRTGEKISMNFAPKRKVVGPPIVPVSNGGNSGIIDTVTPKKICKKKKYSLFPYCRWILAAIVLCIGCFLARDQINDLFLNNEDPKADVEKTDKKKPLVFSFYDIDGSPINDENVVKLIVVQTSNHDSIKNEKNSETYQISLRLMAESDTDQQMSFLFSIDGINIDLVQDSYSCSKLLLSTNNYYKVKLITTNNLLTIYSLLRESHKEPTDKEIKEILNNVNAECEKIKEIYDNWSSENDTLVCKIKQILDKLKPAEKEKKLEPQNQEQKSAPINTTSNNNSDKDLIDELKNSWSSRTRKELSRIKSEFPKDNANFLRAEAMDMTLKAFIEFEKNDTPLSIEISNLNLNNNQIKIIKDALNLVVKDNQKELFKTKLRNNCYERSGKEKYSFGNIQNAIEQTLNNK